MTNRLKDATSPYLLQHAENPVDWHQWGDEAFAEARDRDVPIFLSVGYSSCHWCHVMAHESFEDDDTAGLMNERFVNVKVDREERPDVDAVYMEATQALTGHGGWPMSVFLTPDGRPFFAGTYWPPDDRAGMPGFRRIMDAVWEAWTERRDEIAGSADRIAEAISARAGPEAADRPDVAVGDRAAPLALRAWDRTHGGFGRAPKFPQAMTLEWLLDRYARESEAGLDADQDALFCVTQSLDAMARGGIRDQVGGGFHRYSTDARWLVPHFEKMLYDNALLAPVYAKAAALTGEARFDRVARSTVDYLLREMRHPGCGFYSATDADSEGEEGRFFVWSADEFAEVVAAAGAGAETFAAFFDVTAGGNWEGTNILHEPVDRTAFCEQRGLDLAEFTVDLDRVTAALRERREGRVHPGLDDKVLTSWNALAVRALVLTGMHLGLPDHVAAAAETADFLLSELVVDGRLHHVWKDGHASVPAFLEDVAFLADALLELYAATGEPRWFTEAQRLAETADEHFRDADGGGFFATAHDAEALFTRPKDSWDNATPSGNSVMAGVAMRLAAYTGEARWRETAEEVVAIFQADAERAPTGFGWFLGVCEALVAGPREVAIVGRRGQERELLVRALWETPRTGVALAVAAPDDEAMRVVPLLAERGEIDGLPAAYLCRDFVCERPVTAADDLRSLLRAGG